MLNDNTAPGTGYGPDANSTVVDRRGSTHFLCPSRYSAPSWLMVERHPPPCNDPTGPPAITISPRVGSSLEFAGQPERRDRPTDPFSVRRHEGDRHGHRDQSTSGMARATPIGFGEWKTGDGNDNVQIDS